MLSLVDLAAMHFFLTRNSPKKGTLSLRAELKKRMLRLLDMNREHVAFHDFLCVWNSLVNCYNSQGTYYVLFDFLKSREEFFARQCQMNPQAAFDLLYTFANCKLD